MYFILSDSYRLLTFLMNVLDRRPVLADLWTSVPAYELMINGVPRTILATNKMEDLNIFVDFSIPIVNTTQQILNALVVNSGNLVPLHGRNQGNHRFKFQVATTAFISTNNAVAGFILGAISVLALLSIKLL